MLSLCLSLKWAKLMLGRVNKMCSKLIYSTFQIISVQTHQCWMLTGFNFTKIWKHPYRLAAFACSTVSWLSWWEQVTLVLQSSNRANSSNRGISLPISISAVDFEHQACNNNKNPSLFFCFCFLYSWVSKLDWLRVGAFASFSCWWIRYIASYEITVLCLEYLVWSWLCMRILDLESLSKSHNHNMMPQDTFNCGSYYIVHGPGSLIPSFIDPVFHQTSVQITT